MVRLREITEDDVPRVNGWRADREGTRYLTSPFRHAGLEADEDWFASYRRSRERQVRLMVLPDEGEEAIGVAYVLGIDWISRSAELGLWLAEPGSRGRGQGREALKLLVSHALGDLNLRRLSVRVHEEHEAALRLYASAGFEREGVLKEALYKEGAYHDVVLMALVHGERAEEETE